MIMATVSRNLLMLQLVIGALALMITVAHFWFWFDPESFAKLAAPDPIIEAYGGMEALTSHKRLLVVLISAVPNLALLWALFHLYRLTVILSGGRWFDEDSEIGCRRVGRWLLIYVGLSIISRTAMIWALTYDNPPGERHIAISFSNHDLMALVPALLALVIGHMVKLARAQRDELREII